MGVMILVLVGIPVGLFLYFLYDMSLGPFAPKTPELTGAQIIAANRKEYLRIEQEAMQDWEEAFGTKPIYRPMLTFTDYVDDSWHRRKEECQYAADVGQCYTDTWREYTASQRSA